MVKTPTGSGSSPTPQPPERSGAAGSGAEKDKKPRRNKQNVVAVGGKRNMVMRVLNRNEINFLIHLSNSAQAYIAIATFFFGLLFTVVLTKISIPVAEYNQTVFSSLYPWLAIVSVL